MDFFSLQFLYALGAIVLIDLVLAGDNAIVIALAARKLPADLQRRAILWGTVGAIAVRSLMTVTVVWLLNIPGLMLVGGALLLWIAVKLLAPQEGGAEEGHSGADSFWGAMKTIVIADAVMGLDNVLGVAGAAQGSFLLVVLGLLISIPIVVWGSTLILKWVERFPIIIYAGAGVLAWTAAQMMLGEPLVKEWFAPYQGYAWLVQASAIASVLGLGYFANLRKKVATPVAASVAALSLKETAAMTIAPALSESVVAVTESIASGSTTTHAMIAAPAVLLPVNDSPAALAAVSKFISSTPRGTPVRVHVAHVIPAMHRHITWHLPAGAAGRFSSARSAVIEPALHMLHVAGFATESHVIKGRDSVREILRLAERVGAQRIVIGTTQKSGLVRFLTHSVTARLLERAPMPVEVVINGGTPWYVRFGLPAGFIGLIAVLALD